MHDHREPEQWRFFVLDETRLPLTKRPAFVRAARCGDRVSFDRLSGEVERVRRRMVGAKGGANPTDAAIDCTIRQELPER